MASKKNKTILNTGRRLMDRDRPKTRIRQIEKNLYIDNETNSYVARVFKGGRTFQKTLLSTSKTAARFEKDEWILDIRKEASGIPTAKNMPSVFQAIDQWERDKKGEGITEKYLKIGAALLKTQLQPIGHIKIDKVSTGQLKELVMKYHQAIYIKGGTERHHTPRNTNSFIMLIKSLFTFFYEIEKIQISPAARLKTLPKPELRRNIINQFNFDIFFNEIDKLDLFFLSFATRAMYYLGLRISEAKSMKWADYDENRKKFCPGKSAITKGKEATEIKVPPQMIEWIDKAKGKSSNLVYICPNPETNLPYHSNSISRRLIEISEKLGFKIKPHDLRASFITLASQTKDLPTVQKIARHRDVKTTMGYIQVNQERMDEAIDDMFGAS